ncbi:FMN-dependent NADH-azoreductase [Paenibacillus hemerocallicola]|uniref:FMN dependent NADH:quinone oxidoreductase n=1 Tax=Paenibacillus hemerocallicola TaxID=1172614 RepID=A0A5C4TG06_9BACL|nr:FMN-dependent NADH-azoreductase [Paenibacillus hemerocallicola]TNJ67732.1 FMN-dependent NADH-azoreductase [Paenibacillus hemerocallicola]
MANVLFVKANDRPVEQAASVKMYETFLNAYKETHPSDVITELDLYKEELPYYGNNAITGNYKLSQGYDLTEEEKSAAAVATRYLDQFLAADKIVIAFPLWNFTAPAPLINYMAYITQVGKTFKYTAEGPVGLVGDKKVVLLNARGGIYSVEPMSSIESAVKPLKATLGLFGIQPLEVIIEGHNQFKDRSEEIISEGLKETAKLAASF